MIAFGQQSSASNHFIFLKSSRMWPQGTQRQICAPKGLFNIYIFFPSKSLCLDLTSIYNLYFTIADAWTEVAKVAADCTIKLSSFSFWCIL